MKSRIPQAKSPLKVKENQNVMQQTPKGLIRIQTQKDAQLQYSGFSTEMFFNHYFFNNISQKKQNKHCIQLQKQSIITFEQNSSLFLYNYNSPTKSQYPSNQDQYKLKSKQSQPKTPGKTTKKPQHLKRLQKMLKPYQHKSITYQKSSKDIGFLKRYETITSDLIPFTFLPKRTFIQTKIFKQIIESIYDCYEEFLIQRFKWRYPKSQSFSLGKVNLHLQEFVIYKLLSSQNVFKNAQAKLEEILDFFYTLNSLKISNRQIKIFSDFLQGQQQNVEQFFAFLVIRRFSCIQDKIIREKINQQQQHSSIGWKTFDRILRILQASDDASKKEEKQNSGLESSYREFSFLKTSRGLQNVNKNKIYLHEAFEVIKKQKISVNCLKIQCLKKFIKKFQKLHLKSIKQNESDQTYSVVAQKDTLDQIMQTTTQDLIDSLKIHFDSNPEYSIIDRILVNQTLGKLLFISNKIFLENQSLKNREKIRQQFLEEAIEYLFKFFVKLFQVKSLQDYCHCDNGDSENQQQFSQLKRVYTAVVKLYNFDVLVVTKLTENILKSSLLKSLIKKYCNFY